MSLESKKPKAKLLSFDEDFFGIKRPTKIDMPLESKKPKGKQLSFDEDFFGIK